jgi:hypothetical protein
VRFLHPASPGSRALLARASVLTTAAFLLGAMLTPTMAGTTTTKPYEDSATPYAVASTGAAPGTFSITNDASPQTLGSANITLSQFTIVSGAVAGTVTLTGALCGGTTSLPLSVDGTPSTSGTACIDSNGAIELRNLNLAPGSKVTVSSFTINTSGVTGSAQWATQVKQSNNFNGPPGNNFTLLKGTSDPTLTVCSGQCTLAFAAQPASAAATAPIASTPYAGSAAGYTGGQPITVLATDGNGHPLSGVPVTIGLGTYTTTYGSTTTPVLSGTKTASTAASSGIASFGNLSINTSGTYTLLIGNLSGFSISNNPSNEFAISDSAIDCSTSTSGLCAGSDTGPSGTGVNASSPTSSGFLALTISGQYPTPQTCLEEGYTTHSGLVTIDIIPPAGSSATGTTIATIDIPAQYSSNQGVSSFQVCFASSTGGWTDRLGAVVPANEYSLLPDCTTTPSDPNPATAPCVISRNRSPNGTNDVLLTFAFPSGDPKSLG